MGEAIRIQVNGETRDWRGGVTVADLLRDLEIATDRVAVEVNLEILDRARFAEHRLQDGDRVEILSFIGGGALCIGDGGVDTPHVGEPRESQEHTASSAIF
ncbi:MAG: sulfur carrier protein ThiS [Nitrospira sp.]|nr:sulfur carrier protein ThiS [Nitrospira sp.]MCP9460839.1 sulfur carrier protein ThiS [Nitrospira sp.]MCP9474280.1 sulfur carrier protein ThiS [Nitrospira sp.]